LPGRGVNEPLYRRNWHTKAVMKITSHGDVRRGVEMDTADDYIKSSLSRLRGPRYNDAFAAANFQGGNRT